MANKKFSQFDDGGEMKDDDQVVGLRAGVNTRFDFPGTGIKDSNGNYLLSYPTSSAVAVNYPEVSNSITASSVKYGVAGSDTNIDVEIVAKGSGSMVHDNLSFNGNTIVSSDTNGDINLTPNGTGDLVLDGQKWPQADGSANTLLTTDGAGQTSWTTATFPGTAGASGTILRSDGTNWVASTSTFADTYGASTLLYSNGANTVQGLATANSAVLRTNASGVPSWTSSMTNGQVLIGSTGASPTPATLTASGGISISNGAASITISGTGGGYGWTEVTGTSQSMASHNGYIANNASLVTLTLPASSAVGDTLIIQGKGAGLFKIGQNAGQTINYGSSPTTTGTGGSLTAVSQYNSLEMVCITANTDWAVLAGVGSFTVV